jgi:uncharacterized protein DUF3108
MVFVSFSAASQDCKGYYYLNNGEIQMTLFDKKGAENGKVTYTVTDVIKSGSGTTAKFTSVMNNEKGKLISKGAGMYKCNGDVMLIDAKVAMPGEQMSPYKDMEVKSDDVFIEYPASLSPGQSLKDVNFKMEVYNGPAIHSTITLEQINRKVIGKETVTTSAGTWDCYKITYDGKMRALMAPLNIGIPFNYQATEWYAPGFGLVKTETKNKNGKVMGTTAITSVKK